MKKFLAACEACMEIFRPTLGFKGKTVSTEGTLLSDAIFRPTPGLKGETVSTEGTFMSDAIFRLTPGLKDSVNRRNYHV